MRDALHAAISNHVRASLLTAPAACAIIGLGFGPRIHQLIFDAGPAIFRHNLWSLLLLPYIVAFLLVIGRCLPPRLDAGPGLSSSDVLVVELFTGSAALMLAGYVMGLAGLLYPALTAVLFCGTLYLSVYRNPGAPARYARASLDWLLARGSGLDRPSDRGWQLALAALRLGIVGAVVYQTLQIAFAIDIRNGDVYQLYASYMGEVRRQHGTQLDPALPRFVDYLVSRGNGVHLFLTSFTYPFFIQAIGTMFLFFCMLATRQICTHLLPADSTTFPGRVRILTADTVLLWLLAGNWSNPAYHIAKFHTQTSALFLFCLWATAILFKLDAGRRSALSRKTALVFFSIPLSQIAYQAVSAIIIGLAALRALAEKERKLFLPIAGFVGAGALAVVVTSCVDWIYIGIPSLTPFSFFRRLIRPEAFSRWGSEDVLVYTDMIQGIAGRPVFRAAQTFRDAIVPFSTDGIISQMLVFGLLAVLLIVVVRALTRPMKLSLPAMTAVVVFIFSMLAGFICHPAVYPTIHKHVVFYLIVYSLVVYLVERESSPVSLPFPRALYGLWAYFFLMSVLAVIANTPSLGRLSVVHLTFIERATKWAVLFFLIHFYSKQSRLEQSLFWCAIAGLCLVMALVNPDFANAMRGGLHAVPPQDDLGRLKGIAVVAVSALILTRWTWAWRPAAVVALVTLPVGLACMRHAPRPPAFTLSPQLDYFRGRISLLDMTKVRSPWVPGLFRTCAELARSLPDDDSTMVNLNDYVGMGWCVYSEDLPRGKIQHQYQSVFTRNFGPLVLGRPEESRALYQKLKIDYFFIKKDTGDFWGAGSSELFSKENLARYFDVAVDADSFYLLTWRGRGRSPVTRGLAERIDAWRRDPTLENWAVPRAEAFRQYREWAAAKAASTGQRAASDAR